MDEILSAISVGVLYFAIGYFAGLIASDEAHRRWLIHDGLLFMLSADAISIRVKAHRIEAQIKTLKEVK